MSELGKNEEGVGGRADSLNFFEVIPSSSRENHFGGENHFFSSLCPPTPVMEVCWGSFHRSYIGEKL